MARLEDHHAGGVIRGSAFGLKVPSFYVFASSGAAALLKSREA